MDDLLRFLSEQPDCILEQVGEHELDVSLLGSRRSDALRMELELRLRAWQAARQGAVAELLLQTDAA
jgi:hypothetical protein